MPTILVIEGDDQLRDNIVDWLEFGEFEGFNLFVASNGREGLEIARDKCPDLIVCDALVSGETNVVKEIRASEGAISNVPIILFSARAYKHDIQMGLDSGVTLYLVKPCPLDELVEGMRSL